jgi:hypothetical protein
MCMSWNKTATIRCQFISLHFLNYLCWTYFNIIIMFTLFPATVFIRRFLKIFFVSCEVLKECRCRMRLSVLSRCVDWCIAAGAWRDGSAFMLRTEQPKLSANMMAVQSSETPVSVFQSTGHNIIRILESPTQNILYFMNVVDELKRTNNEVSVPLFY